MSKDANSFGHDKALAWESRGFVYTKRGCIVSTHPHLFKYQYVACAILRCEYIQSYFHQIVSTVLFTIIF